MAGDHRDEGCNPCCCWNLKDGAVTIGIWSLVYSIASLFLFGWQTYVISSCQTVTMAQSNLQCEYYCPCVGASSKRTAAIIEGLFIIQILCLISVFFLLFASIALIYGVHTWSRYLMFPWFICMLSSILTSLAYCIMWWAGDVRDYWLALTILEIIGVIINIYCLVAVIVFYRRIQAETDYYEGKNRSVVYRSTRSVRSSRRDLLENQFDSYDGNGGPFPEHARIDRARNPQNYPNGYPTQTPQPAYHMSPPNNLYNQQPYQPVLKAFPQPSHMPVAHPPYPIEGYEKEPSRAGRPRSASTLWEADDPVGSWVKDQQDIGGRRVPPDEANSEPAVGTPPVRNLGDLFPLQHSRSVPSMYDDDDHRHKRRNSSRRRHRSGDRDRRDRDRDRGRDRDRDRHRDDRDDRDRRHRSRNRASSVGRGDFTSAYYSSESDTDFSRARHGSSHRRRREEGRRSTESESERTERSEKRRRRRDDDTGRRSRAGERERRGARAEEKDDFPLSGGLTIPQHIVIPPSVGTRGPDGRLEPQKYQINSEIVIKYDKDDDGSVRVVPAPTQRQRLPATPTSQRIQSTF